MKIRLLSIKHYSWEKRGVSPINSKEINSVRAFDFQTGSKPTVITSITMKDIRQTMAFTEEFLDDFNERFNEFRQIEADSVRGKGGDDLSTKSFALLSELEMCYASKAYVACIMLACTAIEASIKNKIGRGNLAKKIEESGYKKEVDWLRILRNELVHEINSSHIEQSCFADVEDMKANEDKLQEYCKRAFRLMHEIHFSPIK